MLTAIRQAWPNAQVDPRDPANVWGNALEGLNADQVRHGIRELSRMRGGWSPPPGDFRALCLTFKREELPEPPALPDPLREVRREAMAQRIGALAKALKLQVPEQDEPDEVVKSRLEQEACEHVWTPHRYYGGNWCSKCRLTEVEIEALQPRQRVERHLAR